MRISFRGSIFSQLVGGAIVVIAVVAPLWFLASDYYLRGFERANLRRWTAGDVTQEILDLRRQEQEFLQLDILSQDFYKTGDSPNLRDHVTALGLSRTLVDSLTKLSPDDGRSAAVELRQDLDAYATAFRDMVTEIRALGFNAVHARPDTVERAGLRTRIVAAVAAMEQTLTAINTTATRESESARRRLVAATPLVMLVAVLVALALFYFFAARVARMTRELESAAEGIGQGRFNSRVTFKAEDEFGRLGTAFNRMAENLAALVGAVHQSSTQLNASTAEIAATARQQEATASEIAATTREVGATARTISATSQDLAGTVRQVATVAEQTATLAGAGQTGLTRLDATMRQVTEASASVSARLAVLSEKAGNITSVVTTIVKVADQTNLLSLNAAIEAEKAGEYGRGFAVVAAEIRRLADQTALATADIERIIREMQSAVTAGVMGMDKFSDEVRRGVDASEQVSHQLAEIIAKVQALAPHFDVVNNGMQSQAEGAQQISEALSQLSASAQQTVESLSLSNRTIEQLNAASLSLQAGVSRFTTTAP